ncbi:hypothetical protein [Winogradskyella poriferorum]|uniref:hypothetical protein n=1 Tax=Winogradskyella poriferorum TaxID=307627 RepID=UPI003D64F06E
MKNDICNACGSSKLMHDMKIVDFGHGNVKNDLSVIVQTTDRAFLNKFEKGKLRAQICGSCGKVDLTVVNPQELWEAYLKNKSI